MAPIFVLKSRRWSCKMVEITEMLSKSVRFMGTNATRLVVVCVAIWSWMFSMFYVSPIQREILWAHPEINETLSITTRIWYSSSIWLLNSIRMRHGRLWHRIECLSRVGLWCNGRYKSISTALPLSLKRWLICGNKSCVSFSTVGSFTPY